MRLIHVKKTAIAFFAGMSLLASPLQADMHGKGMEKGMMGDQKGGMMHDMADSMMSMSGDMGKGKMNAAQQKQMAANNRRHAARVGSSTSRDRVASVDFAHSFRRDPPVFHCHPSAPGDES